jgi:tetratricopeptide (TPR) repeat protein
LLVYPGPLSPDYSFNQIPVYGSPGNSGGDTLALISLFGVVLLLVAAILLCRKNRMFSWGVLFFFTMMLPTSNLLMVIGSIMAERFLYLPSIGISAAAASLLCAFPKARVAAINWILPVTIIAALGIRTIYRNADWRDDLSLWSSAVAVSPQSFRTHMAYGNAIWTDAQRNGKPAEPALREAIRQTEIARSILSPEPPIPPQWQNNSVYINLGENYGIQADLLKNAGRHDEAAEYYRKSIEALVKAQEIDRFTNEASRDFRIRRGIPADEISDVGNFVVYKLLGMTYCKVEQWQDCEMTGRYLQHLAPDEPTGYLLVGAAASSLNRPSEAAVQFVAGLLLDPRNDILWGGLQASYRQLGLPNPVTNSASGKSLNSNMPELRKQLNEAAAMIVRLFEGAGRLEPARRAREQFIKQYAVPPEVFSTQ